MHIKAISAEAVGFAEHKPLTALLVGAAVIAGGYYYYTHRSIAQNLNADPTASTTPVYAPPPQVYGSGGGGGIVAGATNDPAIAAAAAAAAAAADPTHGTGGTKFDWATLKFEESKSTNEYNLAEQQLNQNLTIANLNADIAQQGIAAANWTTSAGLAQSFIASGQTFVSGDVGGQTFAFLGSGAMPDFGNPQRRQQVYEDTLNWSANMYQEATSAPQPVSSPPTTNISSSAPSVLSVQPTGSYSPAPSYTSASAGSVPSPTNSTSYMGRVSTYQQSAYE